LATRLVNGVIDGTYPDVHAILVYHQYALRLEEYFYGYDRDRPHQMRSLTKSVISLLAGIAVDRGLIGVDEPILAKLGYASYANPDPRKARITLLDLLSNQSGLACDDRDGSSPGNEVKLYESDDWPRALVDLPMIADPGTVGRYCSGGFFTVGRIIERVAGKPLSEFADEVLFAPLGMRREHWKWNFTLNRSQRNEFGQLYLRPRDMLKLGLLIQQRGEWDRKTVISARWIERAIARQSRVDDSDYGLGIWHRWYNVRTDAGDRRVDTIMLSGNGGQKVYLVPTLELIVVFTGGAFNAESPVNDIMARVLLPALLAAQEAEARKALRAMKDPAGALRDHVEQLTGKNPLDCGQLQRPRPPGRGEDTDLAAIERALACGREASSRRQPFFAYFGGFGVDSWLAAGLLGKADGSMWAFGFDSMPCGGPGCPSRFDIESCERPVVHRNQFVECVPQKGPDPR
jgi:CubicO group peptidase (beta-lactamase class C family)